MTNALTRYEGQGEVNLPAMMQQGEMVIQSRIFGERFKTPAQVVAVMLAGREIGLTPMQAARELYLVNGQVGTSAKVMEAQFSRGGRQWLRITASSDNQVTGIVHLADGSEYEHTLTRAEADSAKWPHNYDREKKQWVEKPTWRSMPKIMLEWAWKRTAIRRYDSSALLGGIVIDGEVDLPTTAEDAEAMLELKRQELAMLQEQIATIEERMAALATGDDDDNTIDGVVTDLGSGPDPEPEPAEEDTGWYKDKGAVSKFVSAACEYYGISEQDVAVALGDLSKIPSMAKAKALLSEWVTEQAMAKAAQEPML